METSNTNRLIFCNGLCEWSAHVCVRTRACVWSQFYTPCPCGKWDPIHIHSQNIYQVFPQKPANENAKYIVCTDNVSCSLNKVFKWSLPFLWNCSVLITLFKTYLMLDLIWTIKIHAELRWNKISHPTNVYRKLISAKCITKVMGVGGGGMLLRFV